jgi:hypothetical protein
MDNPINWMGDNWYSLDLHTMPFLLTIIAGIITGSFKTGSKQELEVDDGRTNRYVYR